MKNLLKASRPTFCKPTIVGGRHVDDEDQLDEADEKIATIVLLVLQARQLAVVQLQLELIQVVQVLLVRLQVVMVVEPPHKTYWMNYRAVVISCS